MKAAFHRLAFHLLDHRFPGHPDFDPNGTGRELRSAELDTVAGAVDLAAQDKVGRYEVPRGDVAALKKIANPLKLGVMHEQAFVLLHEWPDLINRKAAGLPQVTVAQIRNWIKEEQPGLPALVQNLVVVCYSIQANKEWLRGGQPVPAPAKVEAVTDDLALRSQELPTDAEFEEASRRAQGIFQVPREPVRSARSVQATAQLVRKRPEDCARRPSRCRTNSNGTRRRWAWPKIPPGWRHPGSSPRCSPSSPRPTARRRRCAYWPVRSCSRTTRSTRHIWRRRTS